MRTTCRDECSKLDVVGVKDDNDGTEEDTGIYSYASGEEGE